MSFAEQVFLCANLPGSLRCSSDPQSLQHLSPSHILPLFSLYTHWHSLTYSQPGIMIRNISLIGMVHEMPLLFLLQVCMFRAYSLLMNSFTFAKNSVLSRLPTNFHLIDTYFYEI